MRTNIVKSKACIRCGTVYVGEEIALIFVSRKNSEGQLFFTKVCNCCDLTARTDKKEHN